MNTRLFETLPLPCQGVAVKHDARRRRRFGAFRLAPSAVDRFNEMLCGFQGGSDAIDCDQLVTAGRSLAYGRFSAGQPACIRQRLQRARAAVAMCGDAAWGVQDDVANTVDVVKRYVTGHDDLIPDEVPIIGRLDDAILIEAAWPQVRDEVFGYLDFRRLRLLAVGRDAERSRQFDRDAWRQAQLDEARLVARLREVRERHYGASPALQFRVC